MTKICEKCGEDITEVVEQGWMHVCEGSNIICKGGEGSQEEQKKSFKNDILQPYHKNGKINGEFIKVYGKQRHPKYNKNI